MGERGAVNGVPTFHIWQESKMLMEILHKIMSRKNPNLVILHLIKKKKTLRKAETQCTAGLAY